MKALSNASLPNPLLDRVRRDLTEAVRELQRLPSSEMRVIENVTLATGIETPVAHGLGRPARWVQASCPRDGTTSGRILEIRSGNYDRAKYVVLKANGWGATITVDVVVL
jgi:hypothetical protein